MARRTDELETGDRLEPLELTVTPVRNRQFVEALDDYNPIYRELVHPGLLLCMASFTRSPSFSLPDRVQAVGAKMESEFIRPGRVGEEFKVEWEVTDVSRKRSRVYQTTDVAILGANDDLVMKRRHVNTFIGGEHLERRVRWEIEADFRHEDSKSVLPEEGFEIVGRSRDLSIEKMLLYSGGFRDDPSWPVMNFHTNREVSIRSGVGRPVASGLMFESFLAGLMVEFMGADFLKDGRTKIVFTKIAGDGDTVIPKAVIESRRTEAGRVVLGLRTWCEDQYRDMVAVGSAQSEWFDRP